MKKTQNKIQSKKTKKGQQGQNMNTCLPGVQEKRPTLHRRDHIYPWKWAPDLFHLITCGHCLQPVKPFLTCPHSSGVLHLYTAASVKFLSYTRKKSPFPALSAQTTKCRYPLHDLPRIQSHHLGKKKKSQ